VEDVVRLSFWSDEERWFVPRALGLGYSLNWKYAAKRLGWIKGGTSARPWSPPAGGREPGLTPAAQTREERLRERIELSKYEDAR